VILAVAGSAVGLGNFLRFPGIAAQNGRRGRSMIPYFGLFLFAGLSPDVDRMDYRPLRRGFEHSTAAGNISNHVA